MSELQRCEECGDTLAATGVLGGFCPRCMVELGFDSHFGFEYPENTLSARASGMTMIDQSMDN